MSEVDKGVTERASIKAEYLVRWREDLSDFISIDIIERCTASLPKTPIDTDEVAS